jgi:predicted lipoprotein with Yx(FWY)xxD motif
MRSPFDTEEKIDMRMHVKGLARTGLALAALATVALGGAAMPAAAEDQALVTVHQDAELGSILTDADGMTLYLYTKDDPGVSNCYEQCAVAWPPLLTEGTPVADTALGGKLGTTERTDGALQVTYNGMPLYYWFKDTAAGETTGQNVGGVWFVINP